MMLRTSAALLLGGCLLLTAGSRGIGCRDRPAVETLAVVSAPNTDFPPRVARSERGGLLWVYLPSGAQASKPNTSLPVVFIAPAGSRLFHGMRLADGDRPEHLPWVKAGFAVVAYEISGPITAERPDNGEVIRALQAFTKSRCGIEDARAAIDWALKNIPGADAARLYSVGHSSAATLALQIAACVAFAPEFNVPEHLGAKALQALNQAVPGTADLFTRLSPDAAGRLPCPLFLFCAADSVISPDAVRRYSELQKKQHAPDAQEVTFVEVASGEHYDAMIQQGIPRAIPWVQHQKPIEKGSK